LSPRKDHRQGRAFGASLAAQAQTLDGDLARQDPAPAGRDGKKFRREAFAGCIIQGMNYLSFIASVVGSLAIPVTVVTALVIFRRPLGDLVGRVSSYEGMGQKVTFGRKLASAEAAVNVAVAQAHEAATDKETLDGSDTERAAKPEPAPGSAKEDHALHQIMSAEPNIGDVDLRSASLVQLAEIATSNPSFTVIKAYDELETAMNELADMVQLRPDRLGLGYLMGLLADARLVSSSFVEAVIDLRDLRNRVAHGRHNPTAGEAVTYVESVRKLMNVVAEAMGYSKARLDAFRAERQILEEELRAVKAELADIANTPDNVGLRNKLEAKQKLLEKQLRSVAQRQNSWLPGKSA
jgi:hypothetical protein